MTIIFKAKYLQMWIINMELFFTEYLYVGLGRMLHQGNTIVTIEIQTYDVRIYMHRDHRDTVHWTYLHIKCSLISIVIIMIVFSDESDIFSPYNFECWLRLIMRFDLKDTDKINILRPLTLCITLFLYNVHNLCTMQTNN